MTVRSLRTHLDQHPSTLDPARRKPHAFDRRPVACSASPPSPFLPRALDAPTTAFEADVNSHDLISQTTSPEIRLTRLAETWALGDGGSRSRKPSACSTRLVASSSFLIFAFRPLVDRPSFFSLAQLLAVPALHIRKKSTPNDPCPLAFRLDVPFDPFPPAWSTRPADSTDAPAPAPRDASPPPPSRGDDRRRSASPGRGRMDVDSREQGGRDGGRDGGRGLYVPPPFFSFPPLGTSDFVCVCWV